MTVGGYRCRVGNPRHPFYNLYMDKGMIAVFKAMGLLDSAAERIKKEVLALYDKHIEGYVYIISNPAWPDWIKVGMAIDAYDRCNGYQTSSPHRDYVLEHSFYSHNRRKDESTVHHKLENISDGRLGEWFKIPVADAIQCMTGISK